MRNQVIEYVGLVGQHRRNSRQEDNSGLHNGMLEIPVRQYTEFIP